MSSSKKRAKWFWSYRSAMDHLTISRRTLQRWLDDLDIEPLAFEDHLKVFLSLRHIETLKEYGDFMSTRDQSLIKRYRDASINKNTRRLNTLRRELAKRLTEMAERQTAAERQIAKSSVVETT